MTTADWERLNNFWADMAHEYADLANDPKGFFWVWTENRIVSLEAWGAAMGLKPVEGN